MPKVTLTGRNLEMMREWPHRLATQPSLQGLIPDATKLELQEFITTTHTDVEIYDFLSRISQTPGLHPTLKKICNMEEHFERPES